MKRAFVFSGQGSQYSGMGRDIYESSSLAKKLFDQANEILGFDLTKIMFNGPEEKLRQTEIAQLAIFLYSYCQYAREEKPNMASGHSLGMYTALAAAGALSFEEALLLVQSRAKAMQYASTVNPGAMAVVIGLVDSDVERICSEIKIGYARIGNYNSFGQVVVSGTEEAVAKVMKLAKQEGARMTKRLPVSGAFHCRLMEPAYEGLSLALDEIKTESGKFPVYSDLDGSILNSAKSIRKALLQQLVSPVRWPITIQRMIADGADEFVEVGPGSVLQGMIKRINKNVKVFGVNDFLEAKSNGISNS